jgi:hypothetical protein
VADAVKWEGPALKKLLTSAIVPLRKFIIMDITHALCELSGVIHSYDLSKASVHDINYLRMSDRSITIVIL